MQVKPQYAFGAEGREGVPPNTAIEVTMKLLKIKTVKFVDPEHSGTVVKTILEDGQKYQTPNEDAKVTLSYTACLQDGTQFDKVSPRRVLLSAETPLTHPSTNSRHARKKTALAGAHNAAGRLKRPAYSVSRGSKAQAAGAAIRRLFAT